jgi:uncharacterized protein (TIGR00369 family)
VNEPVAARILSEAELLSLFEQRKPPFLALLGTSFVAADSEKGTATLRFKIGVEFCHSGNIVQGGFVTAMLDAAMAHAVFAHSHLTLRPPTLEIKVSFLKPSHPGTFIAVGRVLRRGRSIVFLEAELFDEAGLLLANATSTAMLVPIDAHLKVSGKDK